MRKLGTTIGEVLKLYFNPNCSVLEFGSNDCQTYEIFGPARYVGIDIDPKVYPVTPGATVIQADVRKWKPSQVGTYDIVICDAHGAMDDPEMYETTRVQVELAKMLGRIVMVDDCWLNDVARPALTHLGMPNMITVDRPGLWIWK